MRTAVRRRVEHVMGLPVSVALRGRHADDVTVLRHWLPDLAERDVYVCGPPAWTDALVAALRAAGLPAHQLHLENFGW